MDEQFKALAELIRESEKTYILDLSDPEDLRRFDIRWKLMHENYANFSERFLNGAKVLNLHLPEEQ